jgi:hypothetical protein
MTILVVRLTSDGIIFGADRNITTVTQNGQYIVKSGDQQKKILKWPNDKALIGYSGLSNIDNIPTIDWLYGFIGRYPNFDSISDLAHHLQEEVQRQIRIDENGNPEPNLLIIHLAGFEKESGIFKPRIFLISNYEKYDPDKDVYEKVDTTFCCDDHLPIMLDAIQIPNDNNLQTRLNDLIKQTKHPIGFQQGHKLKTFNVFDNVLLDVNNFIFQIEGIEDYELNVKDWGERIKMGILTYCAYYESFSKPGMQYVGGGADILYIKWPENS